MAKKGKSAELAMPSDMKMRPSLHISSDDMGVKLPKGMAAGSKIHFSGHGKVSHTSSSDHGDGERHSMSIEVHHLEHGEGDEPGEGEIADPAVKGAKAQMDKALDTQKSKGGFTNGMGKPKAKKR